MKFLGYEFRSDERGSPVGRNGDTLQGSADSDYIEHALTLAAPLEPVPTPSLENISRLGVVRGILGAFERGMSLLEVTPKSSTTRPLDTAWLARVGSELCLNGVSSFRIDVDSNGVSLVPIRIYDIDGTEKRSSWMYKAYVLKPDGGYVDGAYPAERIVRITTMMESGSVANSGLSLGFGNPYRGGFAAIRETLFLLLMLERALGWELRGPVGHVFPMSDPNVTNSAVVNTRKAIKDLGLKFPSIGKLRGHATASAHLDKPSRVGANPPTSLIELRRDLENSLTTAAGIPRAVTQGGGGTSYREAFKAFASQTLVPYAQLIQDELQRKLDPAIVLDTNRLNSADMISKSRAFKAFVDAGMRIEDAAKEVGIDLNSADYANMPEEK